MCQAKMDLWLLSSKQTPSELASNQDAVWLRTSGSQCTDRKHCKCFVLLQ